MTATEQTNPKGDRIRKAIKWISDIQLERPERKRMAIIRDAQIRFDLTPNECEFLEENFSDI